eukprot:m.252254 g.252254  ORF g.252254 m.252254 type:complete len:83 (-) comp15470_c3_seq1:1905-2153(-)
MSGMYRIEFDGHRVDWYEWYNTLQIGAHTKSKTMKRDYLIVTFASTVLNARPLWLLGWLGVQHRVSSVVTSTLSGCDIAKLR